MLPNISLIIPVKNEAKTLPALFANLKEQTVDVNEIVITDAGSTDGTSSLCKSEKLILPIHLIKVNYALPGRGRNLAIKQSQGPLIVSTDAGCKFGSDFIAELAAPLSDNAIDVVYGVVCPDARTIFEKCVIVATFPINFMPSVACMAFKKHVWKEVGGYPETLRAAEDYLFIKKIEKACFKTIVNEKAKIFWRPRSSFGAFFKQYYQYAKGKGQVKVDLIFHLRKLAIYVAILLFCISSFILNTIIWGGIGCVLFILWIGLTVKNHWKWFVEIKSIPQAYFLLPIVVFVRDWAALLGFFVGWIQGTKENVEID